MFGKGQESEQKEELRIQLQSMSTNVFENEINGQEQERHGKGQQGQRTAIPQGTFLVANKPGNNAAAKTNPRSYQERVDPRQKLCRIQGLGPFPGTVQAPSFYASGDGIGTQKSEGKTRGRMIG